MAITTLPLLVLDAMAESLDKDAEKPKEAYTRVRKKRGASWMGLLSNAVKNKNPAQQTPTHKKNP